MIIIIFMFCPLVICENNDWGFLFFPEDFNSLLGFLKGGEGIHIPPAVDKIPPFMLLHLEHSVLIDDSEFWLKESLNPVHLFLHMSNRYRPTASMAAPNAVIALNICSTSNIFLLHPSCFMDPCRYSAIVVNTIQSHGFVSDSVE